MPERERVIFACLRQNDLQCGGAGFRSEIAEIELGERGAEGFGCILEIGRAGAEVAMSWADCAGWDERVVAIRMEADPAESCAEKAGAVRRDVQSVRAAEVDRGCAWGVHDKFAGRRPDRGVNGALFERDAFAVAHRLKQADASAGADLDFTDFGNGDGRSEEHTSELQSPCNLVCRLLL